MAFGSPCQGMDHLPTGRYPEAIREPIKVKGRIRIVDRVGMKAGGTLGAL